MSAPVPPQALTSHLAIVGRTGSGKTYCAKGLVEQLLEEKRRVCVLDPTGAWYGLKSSADGQSAGYPVAVFGGEHADVPLIATMGAPLAELVAGGNLPCVVDLSDFGISERNQFAAAFAETLLRKNRLPLHLVIDEADEFMPQGAAGEKNIAVNIMLNRFDRIIRRGRRLGFRVMMITQRPAVLHKNALTQAGTLIAMRLPAPQDRQAISGWIQGQADVDHGKAVLASLSALKMGEGWVWFPEGGVLKRVHFPRIRTFDSSATPEDGGQAIEPSTLAAVDLTQINEALQEQLRVAAENDVGALRARIRELEKGAPAPAAPVIDQDAIEAARAEGIQQASAALMEGAKALSSLSIQLERESPILLPPPAGAKSQPPLPPPPRPARAARAKPDGATNPAGEKLLAAIARYRVPITWGEACIAAGMLSGNGYFYGGKKWLIENGLVFESGGQVQAQQAGVARAGAGKPLTLREILDLWCAKVRPPGNQMLGVIARHAGQNVGQETLAQQIGLKPGNGYWYGGIAGIRDPGLIEQNGGNFRLSRFLEEAPR